MLLTEITKEIKPLSRFEKLQLIEAIFQMLLDEEDPARYFATEASYPVFTPSNQEKAAAQLQQFLGQEEVDYLAKSPTFRRLAESGLGEIEQGLARPVESLLREL